MESIFDLVAFRTPRPSCIIRPAAPDYFQTPLNSIIVTPNPVDDTPQSITVTPLLQPTAISEQQDTATPQQQQTTTSQQHQTVTPQP